MILREREERLSSALLPSGYRRRTRYCSKRINNLIYSLLALALVACLVFKGGEVWDQRHQQQSTYAPSEATTGISNTTTFGMMSNATTAPLSSPQEAGIMVPRAPQMDKLPRRRRPAAKQQKQPQVEEQLQQPVAAADTAEDEEQEGPHSIAAATPAPSACEVCHSISILGSASTTCGSLIDQFQLEFDLTNERSTDHVVGKHAECQVCLDCATDAR